MTIEQLRDRCAYWQQVLRLQDWDITVEIVRSRAIEDAVGKIHPLFSKKIARIKLQDRYDACQPDAIYQSDQEVDLVHELLHCHFIACEPEDWDDLKGETTHQAIHAISTALVKLDRGRFGPEVATEKSEPSVTEMLVAIRGNGTA